MLASPVSPSVSLGSHTYTSSRSSSNSNQTSPNGTYTSPRHPAYLPSSTENANQTSPSQHSITSSSSAALSQTTSNYSKYTTHSQIERVNDVLVDKVSSIHAPLPTHGAATDGNEKGAALKRLIAFLDGDEEPLQHGRGQKMQEEREHEKRAQPVAGPSHARQTLQAQDHSESVYTPQGRSQTQSHPSTPPSTHRRTTYPNIPNEIQRNHTPRSSNSQGHLHPSHGRAGHQASLQAHYEPAYHTKHDSRRSRSPDVRHTSRAEYTSAPQAPSQSVLLSTQTQLERLKSEVAHLDELVNRLKSQHITTSDQTHPISHKDGQTFETHHQQNVNEDENDNEAGRKQAAEEDRRRRIREYESSPASQNDLLRLIRHLDSLVWMRNPHNELEAETGGGNMQGTTSNGILIGKGTRNDNIIFTKGNLDHLAKRMGAWENIVRRKEEEARYDYGT